MRTLKLFVAIAAMSCVLSGRAWCEDSPSQTRPQIFAHYMTWFQTPEHDGKWNFWNWHQKGHRRDPERIFPDGRRDIASIYYPLIGPYSSLDENVAEYHILLAKAAGIDGFVVNWYGFTEKDGKPRVEDQGFKILIKTAEAMRFMVCINFDDKCMFPPYTHAANRAEACKLAQGTVQRLIQDYAASPAYYRIEGKPVLSNFGWGPPRYSGEKAVSFSPEEWKKILKSENIFFIADHQWHWNKTIFETGFLDAADSIYPWVAGEPTPREAFYKDSQKAMAQGRMKLICGEACPGFDDWGTWGWGGGHAVIDREGGRVYRRTWEESVKFGAQWIQLITWNDFAEGTVIEPTRDFGYQYLEITAEFAAKLGHPRANAAALPLAKAIYDTRLRLRALAREKQAGQWNAVLDQAIAAFLVGDYDSARTIVHGVEEGIKADEPAPLRPAVALTLSPAQAELSPGEKQAFTVTVENTSAKTRTGSLRLDSGGEWPDNAWVKPASLAFSVKGGEKTTRQITLEIPKDAPAQDGILEAQFHAPDGLYRSFAARVRITPSQFLFFMPGPRLLEAGRPAVVRVRLEARQKQPDYGSVILEVPKDWSLENKEMPFELPEQGSREIQFKVKAVQPGPGQLRVILNSRLHGRQEFSQRFQVTESGEVVLFRQDVNQDGVDEFVLGNDRMEVQVASGLGGRILAMIHRPSGHNQLYLHYPQLGAQAGINTRDWQEFGGINDTFPTVWPGVIWNNTWDAKMEASADSQTLILSCEVAEGLAVERRLTLARHDPALRTVCDIQNLGSHAREVIWNNHPDLAPGPESTAGASNALLVPTAQGIAREVFAPSKTKKQYDPNAGWCVALDEASGEYLAQRFTLEPGLQIGAWKGETFFTLEVMPQSFVLEPREHKAIQVDYIVGRGDWEARVKP